MPRNAPKEVVEHRITLGDFERKELRDAINSYQNDKIAENIPNYILGGAGLVASGGIALAAYALWKWLDIGDILDTISKATAWFGDVALDTASAVGIGPDKRERIMIDLSQMTTEEEILAYVNPIINDLDHQIAELEQQQANLGPLQDPTLNNNLIRNKKSFRSYVISQRDFWLRQVATKNPTSEGAKKFGLSALEGGIFYQFTQQNGTPPPCDDEAGRIAYRDAYTTFANAALVGTNPQVYYEAPTGYITLESGKQCIDVTGRMYTIESNTNSLRS